ncbi:hypothetical protein [Allonocardiopsis opalescens]|uniref:Uncharacterized protein n=1 Tax=Allonocardiopsis opalescens TaxID=1144618 RepID=A0A2T0Q2Q4_9ACTN|nr:hypothetical protein [Allonocardiopsis opalescens]PRX98066.1 hypothetical protein CLV72_105419 [Allonocardiopsis opalescens]
MTAVFTWAFVVVAALLILVAVLAVVTIAQLILQSRAGVARDGLERGRTAPEWEADDLGGTRRRSPAPGRWQLLVFADHSLNSFPGVVEGLRALADEAGDELETIVLAREYSREVVGELTVLGVDSPVVLVPNSVYHRYNIRVMPFVVLVGPDGKVGASSLVNHAWQLESLWRLTGKAPAR